MVVVNDLHSKLNATTVTGVFTPWNEAHLVQAVRRAIEARSPIAVAGGRHAMGGQQFRKDGLLIDMRALSRVRRFDPWAGTVDVAAGMMWPELIEALHELQPDAKRPWVIRQKQTGADQLTLGGAVAANIHGRGLRMQPIVSDVVSLRVLCADGEIRHCSRTDNPGLLRMVVGGYGLFGIVLSVKLKLVRQQRLERRVVIAQRDSLMDRFDHAIAEGAVYGDFQFSCDEKGDDLLNRGVFSCYFPASRPAPVKGAEEQKLLTPEDWSELLYLAHADKSRAFELYAGHYLKTSGQVYESDRMQLTTYLDSYHNEIDRRCNASCSGSEMITEVYVPRARLGDFLENAATYIRTSGAHLIYGTVRLIEQDTESFLAWAKSSYACVIFNLHIDHTPSAIEAAGDHFRALIDLGIKRGGSFYLTYHRFATAGQLLAAYPQLPYFLAAKKQHDPAEIFQSDWYVHYRELFRPEIDFALNRTASPQEAA